MYSTTAYYASPIDGNCYEVYAYLNNQQLVPIHFLESPEGLRLVYYPPVPWGTVPSPVDIVLSVNNGLSNIVYYQPRGYGQTQLLFCTSRTENIITLMCNVEFGKFLPINAGDTKMLQMAQSQNSATSSAPFIEQKPYIFPVPQNVNIPAEIHQSLQAVQDGRLTEVSINSNQYGYQLTAEDIDGNRIIIEKHNANEISQRIEVTATSSKAQRQARVEQLRRQKMTQGQIANILGVSQKTISNDLGDLGLD